VLQPCSPEVQVFRHLASALQLFSSSAFELYNWLAGLPIILDFLSDAFGQELVCVWVWFY
jgi:hypothetical protein